MADIRQRVQDDRGIIKKIELVIPGYKGYREKEDLRIADSLLRNQLANQLQGVIESVQRSKEGLAKNMNLQLLNDIGELDNNTQALMNKIRHAQQGYSGISADIRIEQDELNRLYEWDLSLLQLIDILRQRSAELEDLVSQNSPRTKGTILDLKKEVTSFVEVFQKRIDSITNITVR